MAAKRSAAERILDRAIELTFPASDPIAVEHAFRSARKREQAQTADKPPRRESRGAQASRPVRRR
jgi:hypothetical protein